MAACHALARLRARVQASGRWRARAMACALGVAAVFAMPPTYQFYVLFPALSGLLWLADAQPTRWRAFAVGWWFGAGFFAAGLYWVSFALLVEADKFAWLIPIAIAGFAFGFGLFPALCALAARITPGPLAAKALVLAGSWTVLEWVRSWLLTGFPWNPLGSSWLFSETLAQGAAVAGVLGLSFLAALVAVVPGALADGGRAGRWLAGGAALLCVALGAGGLHRLGNAHVGVHEGVRLRLVQPNIRQAEKWLPELRDRHMENQLDLSTRPPKEGDPAPTHVIWSETAAPFFLANHVPWRRQVAAAAPAGGLVVTGAPRSFLVGQGPGRKVHVANSLLAIDGGAEVVAAYDKFHLVPFGEYVPLADWLPLEGIAHGAGGFTPGPGPRTLDLPGLPPVSPLICYEIIFPGQVTDGAGRAQWLLNLTNDAWYGKTAGPHQHFASARLRALEQGVPVVRVAGSGISGIIDAYGRVRAYLPLGERAFLDGDLPRPAARPPLYARLGDAPALALALLALVSGLILGRASCGRGRNSPGAA